MIITCRWQSAFLQQSGHWISAGADDDDDDDDDVQPSELCSSL